MNNNPIFVEQALEVSKQSLWQAITQKEQMVQWFFDTISDFKPKVGFKTQFPVHSKEQVFTHIWEVVEVIPLKKIAYTWQYEEYEGESVVFFEIFQQKDSLLLRVIFEGLETFPQDIPEFSRESCQGGWDYFINRLHLYLNNN